MGKPSREDFNWMRGHGSDKPFSGSTTVPKSIKEYVHIRKTLSTTFSAAHSFCNFCGQHWEGCCPTEFVPECTNPAQCAFNKEMEQ